MTLFIQNNTAIGGTGAVFPNNAEADLLRISDLDLAGFGETTQPPPSNLVQITYEPQATTGFPPTRLHELVNTDFAAIAGNVDIIVVAVTESFLFEGTTPIENVGGVALNPLEAPNTTESALVIYNTGSAGICTKAQGSNIFDLGLPPPVTLFHELSHAFRIVTSASLSLSASGCTASPEEEAAEIDENQMRELMGVRLRDVTNHCGEHCESSEGNCCVVASIATGSESVELSALRAFREGFLRRSEVGHAFFERLHYEYYGYSPQVVAAMGNNDPLVERIRRFFVRPLTRSLTLTRALLEADAPVAEVGARLERSLARDFEATPESELEGALAMVGSGRPDEAMVPPRLRDLEWVEAGPHLRWGILEPVGMYLAAAQERATGEAPDALGRAFAARVEEWAARLPIEPMWSDISEYELRQELEFLRQTLLRTPASRERFAQRLADEVGVDRELARSVLLADEAEEGGSDG